jgi:hypothetical protein
MAWAPDYLTDQLLADYLRVHDNVDDVEFAVDISAASRAIDDHTNRQFGLVAAPEARVYTEWYYDDERGRWVIDIDDLMSTVGATWAIDGTALTDYTLEPRNAAVKGRPWTRLAVARASSVQPTGCEPELDATAPWGWSAVPVPVTLACRLQASRFNARRDSPYGVAGSPDQGGSELRLLARVDPDVGVSLRSFVRPRRAG